MKLGKGEFFRWQIMVKRIKLKISDSIWLPKFRKTERI